MIADQIGNERVREEYLRWQNIVGTDDQYVGKYTVGIQETLDAHFLLADFFYGIGEGIGGVGPKSLEMLHSSLSRQFVEFDGKSKYDSRVEVCASLMFGLVKNHPFHDANKRTAFLVSLLHLQKIGRTPTIDQKGYEDFTVNIADNSLSSYEGLAPIKNSGIDREVQIISWFLKRNTRTIETSTKTVSYNDLKVILRARGLGFERPDGNRIDLVRYEKGHTSSQPNFTRLARVGFHSWTKEVSKTDMKNIRQASGLDKKHGYDSLSFYSGLEGPLELIKKYKEPLERLAFR